MNHLLSEKNNRWVQWFCAEYGHKPRVLMIGNIANNAYNNAKLLNMAGLDCDVICYDYYHVMGCPEWEDADLKRPPKDSFRPDWTKITLGGYSRPGWFAQGPMADCIDYLISKRRAQEDESFRWRALLIHSRVSKPDNIRESLLALRVRINTWFAPWRCQIIGGLQDSMPLAYRGIRRARRVIREAFLRKSCMPQDIKRALDDQHTDAISFSRRCRALKDKFRREFPYRSDVLTSEDIAVYADGLNRWDALFGLYDIIIGFSVDPFRPLLSGYPYFAFEHGTIREIPFSSDAQGRRTALAYRLAKHCFVTNFDCAESARILAPDRHTLINHPYDEDHGVGIEGAERQRAALRKKLDSDFLFFHPTRQDWVEGTGYADKCNDVFLRAFGNLRSRGIRVGLVICSWGANVKESATLLSQLGCSAHVHWISPQAIIPFERMCKACDVVVDQFKIGAFGGVVFKAMAVGSPIITYLNETLVRQQYPELPPVVNCKTTSDIEHAVSRMIQDPIRLSQIRNESRAWIKRHHGKYETINKQVDQFRLHHEAYVSAL